MTKARSARPALHAEPRMAAEPDPLLEDTLRTLRECLDLAEPESLQRARQSVDRLENLVSLSITERQREPGCLTVARFLVAGVEPPDEYWNLLPGIALEDELARDTYFRPTFELEGTPWDPIYLNSATGTTKAIERALEQKGHPCRRRVFERCTEEALSCLGRLAHDCLPRSKRERPKLLNNHRLRLRMATSVHDELKQLLQDWHGEP